MNVRKLESTLLASAWIIHGNETEVYSRTHSFRDPLSFNFASARWHNSGKVACSRWRIDPKSFLDHGI